MCIYPPAYRGCGACGEVGWVLVAVLGMTAGIVPYASHYASLDSHTRRVSIYDVRLGRTTVVGT